MVRNHKLARALSDAAFGQFKQFLTYKVEQRSGMVIEVGRFFASSKLCHVCGYKNDDLELKDREWTCPNPKCRVHHDRDVNAAINIRNRYTLLRQRGPLSTGPEALSLVESDEGKLSPLGDSR